MPHRPKGSSRARFDKHVPPGVRKGVVRSTAPNGSLDYNGHDHISETTKSKVLTFMQGLGRPTTPLEISLSIGYARNYVTNVMRWMWTDGDVARVGPTRKGCPAVYELPQPPAPPGSDDHGETKECAKCHNVYPVDSFHRDAAMAGGRHSRCRWCRSPRTDKVQVRAHAGGR